MHSQAETVEGLLPLNLLMVVGDACRGIGAEFLIATAYGVAVDDLAAVEAVADLLYIIVGAVEDLGRGDLTQ